MSNLIEHKYIATKSGFFDVYDRRTREIVERFCFSFTKAHKCCCQCASGSIVRMANRERHLLARNIRLTNPNIFVRVSYTNNERNERGCENARK